MSQMLGVISQQPPRTRGLCSFVALGMLALCVGLGLAVAEAV